MKGKHGKERDMWRGEGRGEQGGARKKRGWGGMRRVEKQRYKTEEKRQITDRMITKF